MRVTIFVEGGGDSQATMSICRRGFVDFFRKLLPGRNEVTIVPCGGRGQAYKDYCRALKSRDDDEAVVLLVDSEEAIAPDTDPWDHLSARVGDGWEKPSDACDVHLMVQCVESWFLADHEALKKHYKKGLAIQKLAPPVNEDVELISKDKVMAGLKAALKGTEYENYKKKDGFKIVGLLDPAKVCKASKRAEQMRARLVKLTSAKK